MIERAVAERVCAVIEPQAWVLDDTGVVKDGKHSPGVKRQYSGTLGKTGNCQVTVSLHAVGSGGTVPLGFRLYLPEEWCADHQQRRKAKIPDSVEFQTKLALGGELAVRAAGWEIPRAPVLGDQAYGDDSKLRSASARNASSTCCRCLRAPRCSRPVPGLRSAGQTWRGPAANCPQG